MTFEWMETVKEFFDKNLVWKVVFDSYFAILIISVLVFLCFRFKKAFVLTMVGIFLAIVAWFSNLVDLTISKSFYSIALGSYIVVCAIILAPELRRLSDQGGKGSSSGKKNYTFTSDETITAIVNAIFDMAAGKVGALITFEINNTLSNYEERAIHLNSDISKELLEQIFIKDSPLHDGGVIIRGNKIICAAAYYTLTQNSSLDKTLGSRHRAAIGISEVTDSLTIVVSEETGHIHVVVSGGMKEVSSSSELTDYISTYLGENTSRR